MNYESKIKTIEWQNGQVRLIDQTKLPYKFEYVNITSSNQMGDAIRDMIVRGAPAIGIAGAFGLVLGAMEIVDSQDKKSFLAKLEKIGEYLKLVRPTAVNLMWAVDKQLNFAKSLITTPAV